MFDIRICNLDRNSANLVVRFESTPTGRVLRLVPIDHGLCLPDNIEVNWYSWEWMKFPQVGGGWWGLPPCACAH